jgi:hypothetical protein
MCEGMLRSYQDCERGPTLSHPDIPQNDVATGHLWIDTAITGQCKDYNAEESSQNIFVRPTNTRYYASCKFNKEQKIYIWSDGTDKADSQPCPELIVCSHE